MVKITLFDVFYIFEEVSKRSKEKKFYFQKDRNKKAKIFFSADIHGLINEASKNNSSWSNKSR